MPPIDRTLTAPHMAVATAPGSTTTARGRALESYIGDLFTQIPGLRVSARNSLNAAGSQEVDIVFWNECKVDGLYFIANCFLVESKNTTDRVGATEIREFTTKLRDRGQKIGVFVAANGITGQVGHLRQAKDAVSRALREGIQLIVFTVAELEAVATTEELVILFQDKISLLFATESSI